MLQFKSLKAAGVASHACCCCLGRGQRLQPTEQPLRSDPDDPELLLHIP
jgi:hypothetical protein